MSRRTSPYFVDDDEKTETVEEEDDVSMLNEEQRAAYDMALRGESFMIDGAAGVGKTMLIGKISRRLASLHGEKYVAVTAMTGTAAMLIPNACTLHSWSGMQVIEGSTESLVRKLMDKNRAVLRKLRKSGGGEPSVDALMSTDAYTRLLYTVVLFIDEVSMLSCRLFRKLDNVLRRVRGRLHEPFGGMQLILSGDFYQLGPVVKSNKSQAKKRSWEETRQARAAMTGVAVSSSMMNDPDESTDYTELSADEADRHHELEKHRTELLKTGVMSDAHRLLVEEWRGSRDVKKARRSTVKRKRQRVSTGTPSKKYAFQSTRWREAIGPRVVRLLRTYRQEDPVFVQLLSRAREGRLNADDVRLLNTRVLPLPPRPPPPTLATLPAAADGRVILSEYNLIDLKVSGGVFERGTIENRMALEWIRRMETRETGVPELRSKRAEVDEINARELRALAASGADSELFEAAVGVTDRPDYVEPNGAQALLLGDEVRERLELRVGSLVRLAVNISQKNALVNGSTGIVVGFAPVPPGRGYAINDRWGPLGIEYPKEESSRSYVEALKDMREAWFAYTNRSARVPLVYFPEHSKKNNNNADDDDDDDDDDKAVYRVFPVMPFVRDKRVSYAGVSGWVAQIPLKCSAAITIHGSQGVSLDTSCLNAKLSVWNPREGCGSPGIFAAGQAYVGLSRQRTLDGLYLTGIDASAVYASEEVRKWYAEADALKKTNAAADDDDDDDESILTKEQFISYLDQCGEEINRKPSVMLNKFIDHFASFVKKNENSVS